MALLVTAPEFTADEMRWAGQRMPDAPPSVRLLVLRALAAGWCCWEVTGNRATVRNYQHRERTGIVYEVDLVWCNGKGGRPRFSRADLTELREVETTRTIAAAETWLK